MAPVMEYRVRMFDKFKMTIDESAFVANVDASGPRVGSGETHTGLAVFYLGKQIEDTAERTIASNEVLAKSNERLARANLCYSRILTVLTLIIAILTVVMIVK